MEVHGFTVELDVDNTRRAAAEVEADRAERASDRAAGLAVKADRLRDAATVAEQREQAASAALPPMGEPIKIGHHSENRHRRAIEKARTTLSKSVEADRNAEHAAQRAAAAQKTTEQRYKPDQIRRRLETLGADLRRQERARDGHTRTLYTDGYGVKHVEETAPATGEHRVRVLDDIDRLADQITFWEEQLAAAAANGANLWDKTTVAVGDIVYAGGSAYRVAKVNAKSVRVGGEFSGLLPYSKITKVFTKDGEPVTIVDGARVID